ncbi:MAG: hypothetical protein WDM87_02865 [Terracidiphilus sp.]
MVLSNDAGRQRFRSERAGGSRGAFDVEKRDALAVGRECRRVNVAVEFREAMSRAAVEMREIDIGLLAGTVAIGEEGDRRGVRRPDEVGGVAGISGAAAVTGWLWERLSSGARRIWPASSQAIRLPSGETATWVMVRA